MTEPRPRQVLAHLANASTSILVVGDGGMPEVAHWGAALGDERIDTALLQRPVAGGGLDVDPPFGLIAEAARGWCGRPGIVGRRERGGDTAPRFSMTRAAHGSDHADFDLVDEAGGLRVTIRIQLDATGVASLRASVVNLGQDPYHLDGLSIGLPVPSAATDLLIAGGRHGYEFQVRRHTWVDGCTTIENRRGRTSHERVGAVFVGTSGFGEHRGEVWAGHIGWSGNYAITCDAATDGRKVLQMGELLLPDEVVLGSGDRYDTPVVFAAHSPHGLNAVSNAFHAHLRARPHHPRSPRPVHLNTWEAVYFSHDLDTLRRLADAAASIGIERFVLDDGWFGGRRDDRRALGDWWVSPDAWPDGLDPLIEHVRELGMEFGIWVEPEMVSEDSDLYRAHPDWAFVDERHPHVLGRGQLVLDLGRADVRDHLFSALDALLSDHGIAYLKWDHNRDVIGATQGGIAGVHAQTIGVYELLARVRAAHPDVEIETCAAGGGRVDFGVLERTDRVWTSDSIDALDRHRIQRGFSLLFPPELMGSHVGAPVAHTTRRTHRIGFRAIAAFFGSLGVEWNLLEAGRGDLEHLAEVIELHKRFRPLLHSGRVVRSDQDDPSVDVHGVVAEDRGEALLAVTRLDSAPTHHSPPIRIIGLDETATYTVRRIGAFGEPLGDARAQPSWVEHGLVATGRQLGVLGFSAPQLHPESSVLIHVVRDGAER